MQSYRFAPRILTFRGMLTPTLQVPGPVLLAFSGGADSVGLAARWTHRPVLLGYVDHRIRGPRASRVERAAVLRLSRRLGLPLVRTRASVAGRSEAAARKERYRLLAAMARRHGCVSIATAHTADDRAETILFNLLRGCGLRGLAAPLPSVVVGGMQRVRPALDLRRATLRAAAAPFGPVVFDQTNRCTAYARTRTRHLLLPALAERLGTDPVALLCALGDLARSLRAELEQRASQMAGDIDRRALLAECAPAFPYLIEALRGEGPSLTSNAYRGLRDFLRAGRTGRTHTTSGGETWHLERQGGVKVSFPW